MYQKNIFFILRLSFKIVTMLKNQLKVYIIVQWKLKLIFSMHNLL